MDEQKSIRAEIIQLFDRVKNQADEYSSAFDEFNKWLEKLKYLEEKINDQIKLQKIQYDEFVSIINKTIEKEFIAINDKISKINHIWEKLELLINIQNEISKFYTDIRSKYEEIDKSYNALIAENQQKFEELTRKFQNQIQNDFESYISKSELKLILQYKKNESQIQTYSDIISDALNMMKLELHNLKNEIAVIKEKVELNNASENITRINIQRKINEIEEKLNNTNDELTIVSRTMESLKNNLYNIDIEKYAQFQSEITSLSDKLANYEKKLSKMKVLLFIVVASCIFILSFILTAT